MLFAELGSERVTTALSRVGPVAATLTLKTFESAVLPAASVTTAINS